MPSKWKYLFRRKPAFEVVLVDVRERDLTGRIGGTTLVVSAAEIGQPAAVRYAWAEDPKANLYNHAGLPAAPFRSAKP